MSDPINFPKRLSVAASLKSSHVSIVSGKDLHASAFRSTILRLQSIRKPEDIQASLQIKESGTTGADEMDIKDSSSGIELKWQDEAPGGWHEVLDHTFVMESARESEILRNIGEMDSYAFLDWLGRGDSHSFSFI